MDIVNAAAQLVGTI